MFISLSAALGLALALVLAAASLGGTGAPRTRRAAPAPRPAAEVEPTRARCEIRPSAGVAAASARERGPPGSAAGEPGGAGGSLASVVAHATRAGVPAAGAAVVLRHGARPVARASLDATGRARFAGLVPGRYSLEVEAESLPEGVVAPPCPASGSPCVPFTLARGAAREVALLLELAAAIRGRTLDAGGLPVADAWVRLQAVDAELALASRSARSDARGVFELAGVVPGTYRLLVRWPEDALGAAPGPSVHALEPGASLVVNLRAEGEPRAITGRLLDEHGAALAGEMVQGEWIETREAASAPHRAELEPPAPWSRVLARARTDAEGKYRLAGLPRGEVAVRAAPRVGASRAFASGATPLGETLVGRFDLTAPGASIDAGPTVVRAPPR